jgi:hypothetical protein
LTDAPGGFAEADVELFRDLVTAFLMRTDIEEKVLEKLATSDKATIVVERQPDGKMRVTSGSWDGEKVIFARSGARSAKCRRPPARRAQAAPSRRVGPVCPALTIRMARGPSVSAYAGDEAIDG